MRYSPGEGVKHPSREESLLVKQYQELRAAGDFIEADRVLSDLLLRYENRIENVAILLTDEGWDWQDAYQNARAALAQLIQRYEPEEGLVDSHRSLGNYIYRFFKPSSVREYKSIGQWPGGRIGSPSPDFGAFVKTNRMKKLWALVDSESIESKDEVSSRARAARTVYLAFRLPNELYRFIVLRRWGLDGLGGSTQQDIAEELKVTTQNVQVAEQRAYDKLRRYYVPPTEDDREITPEEAERLENIILDRLVHTLHAIQDAGVSGVMWRYYDLDGYGRLGFRELAEQLKQEQGWVLSKMRQGRRMIADAFVLDRDAQEALRRLGLSKIDPWDLLFSFGDELRARFKPKAA